MKGVPSLRSGTMVKLSAHFRVFRVPPESPPNTHSPSESCSVGTSSRSAACVSSRAASRWRRSS